MIDSKRLDVLKTWYAVFCAIMDRCPGEKDLSEAERIEKLQKLRQLLKDEAPELETKPS